MYLRFLSGLALCAFSAFAARPALRVCADPNNLPFSNQAGEGIENRLAEMVARDLGADLAYTWWTQRKSFLEHSLQAHLCDVVMGVPAMMSDSVLVTKPYYTSSYVFVSRSDRPDRISSLLDDRLGGMRIGIHVVDDDYAPPAHLLARSGLAAHLIGFSLYGLAGELNPPAKLIHAVATGDVDIAIVWGPLAGYFSPREHTPLTLTPVSPAAFLNIPFTFGISAAVRKDDAPLRAQIQSVLNKECRAVDALVRQYGIPGAQGDRSTCDVSQPSL